jgi:hypothetical protein
MDGITLADALLNPSDMHTAEQNRLNGELMPLIKALKALSESDIAELNR